MRTRRVLALALGASLVLGVVAVSAIAGIRGSPPASAGTTSPGSAGGTSAATCGLDEPWRCETVAVPRRRLPDGSAGTTSPGSSAGGTIEVRYAVHPATAPAAGGPRRVLVMVSGGPGGSGIEDADWMMRALGPRVTRAFDVVAFDARGAGGTDPHACPAAGRRYSEAAVTASSARAFATECVKETGLSPDDLATFSSRDIAGDIDAIRAALGVDRITVYGVSYGTVITQAYAAAHADRLDGIVLDAPIDRSIPAADLWVQAAKGFGTALDMTLDACAEDPDCHDALPDPHHALERVHEQLGGGDTLSDEITGPDGRSHRETMTWADFEAVAESTMYDEQQRVHLLRGLAAFDHGDRRQLLRLVDVEGGAGHGGSFPYFATWCSDARVSPSGRTDDFDAFTALAVRAGVPEDARDTAWVLAPCLFWPAQPASWAPPAESTTVPMLILASTADPITPVEEARSILGRHPEARLIETQGGAHGSLGDACPGERVADFVVDGRLPVGATSICAGSVIDTFVPVAPSPAASADDAALGLLWEILGAPEVAAWASEDDLRLGCADAGTLRLSLADAGDRAEVTLDGCTWATNATFDGSGWLDLYSWDSDLELASSRGALHLTTRGDRWTLTGTWDGRPVDMEGG